MSKQEVTNFDRYEFLPVERRTAYTFNNLQLEALKTELSIAIGLRLWTVFLNIQL